MVGIWSSDGPQGEPWFPATAQVYGRVHLDPAPGASGIVCSCCDKVISASQFEQHAGARTTTVAGICAPQSWV
jgi:hypothetical protein